MTFGNNASDYDPATGIISPQLEYLPSPGVELWRCTPLYQRCKQLQSAARRAGRRSVPRQSSRRPRVQPAQHSKRSVATAWTPSSAPVRSVKMGNFSRIHTTRTLLAAAPSCPGVGGHGDQRCCSQDDATSQIGCLAEADQQFVQLRRRRKSSAQVLITTSAGNELAFAASINNIKYDQECVVQRAVTHCRAVVYFDFNRRPREPQPVKFELASRVRRVRHRLCEFALRQRT